MKSEKKLTIKAGESEFKITTFSALADTLFINLVDNATNFIKEQCTIKCEKVEEETSKEEVVAPKRKPEKKPTEVLIEALNKSKPIVVNEVKKPEPKNVQAPTTGNKFNLNDRKIRLSIIKCPTCGTITPHIVKDYNSTFECPHCSQDISYDGTMKGHYECSCGNHAIFYMNDELSAVKCNKCGKEYFMILESDKYEYKGVNM